MTEQWLAVPGWEGYYEVSDLGRVRSVLRTLTGSSGITRTYKGRMLRPKVDAGGYRVVCLTRGGITRSYSVHRLVAQTFLGPCPPGHEVRHLDGDPANAVLKNLSYGTSSENARDKLRHGTHNNARKTHCPQGHRFDEANTYVVPTSVGVSRKCRACRRASVRAYVERRRNTTARVAQ